MAVKITCEVSDVPTVELCELGDAILLVDTGCVVELVVNPRGGALIVVTQLSTNKVLLEVPWLP
jgi:hypothetical protein